jgi:hypothetical protein
MAIASIGTRGTAVSGASGTTIARAPSTAVAAGRVLVCQIAQNGNVGTTVTDAQGNDWVFLGSGSGTNARSDIWISTLTTGLSTSNSVTVTFDSAIVDKSMLLWEFSVGAGNTLIASTTEVPNSTSGVNGFGSVNFASLPSVQRLYLRALAKRANITTAITATTNFTTQALTIRSRNNATGAIAQRGEFRINTSTGETSNPTLNNTGNTGNVFVALEEFTPPAAQSLTQGTRFDNTNTFYAHTVGRGAVALTQGTRYDNDQVFYTPNVAASGNTQDLLPDLYTNNSVLYSPTVGRGTITLTVARYDNGQVFYAPSVTVGPVTLTAARYDNAQTFYAAAVTRGAVTLTVPLYTNDNTFYSGVVSGAGVTLGPPRYDNNQTFYAAGISVGTATIAPDLFTNTQDFYAATISTFSSTQFITFPDWVDPGWVEPGWVEWPYFNTNQFFSPRMGIQLRPSLFSDTGGGATFGTNAVMKYFNGTSWVTLIKDPTVYT